MEKKIFIIFFFTLSYSSFTFSAKDETKNYMQKAMQSYVELIPYIQGNQRTSNSKTLKNIQELERSLGKAMHGKIIKKANFFPAKEIIKDSVRDIKASYLNKNHAYTQFRLKRIISTCTSCHTQLPKKSYKAVETRYETLFKSYMNSNNDKALMAYFLRDYQSSLVFLKEEIASKRAKFGYLEEFYKQILKIYLVNLNNDNELITFLKNEINLLKRNHHLVITLKSWVRDIEFWRSRDKSSLTEAGLIKLINEQLVKRESEIVNKVNPKNLVTLYSMQGIMTKFMLKNNSSVIEPTLLYWLGVIENYSSDIYLYSLGDLYLKKCITSYSKSKVASKCYNAYEESIQNGFTGSKGLNVPKDIKLELKKLKKLISD